MLVLAKGNDRLLLKLLFYLGLRLSEARRLQRSDIKNVNGELEFSVVGKGNKFRSVTLSRNLSRARNRNWNLVFIPGTWVLILYLYHLVCTGGVEID